MNDTYKIPFPHNDKDYEIRVEITQKEILVRVFLAGEPASGFTYLVSRDMSRDFESTTGYFMPDHLVEVAKDDIVSDKWGEYLKGLGD